MREFGGEYYSKEFSVLHFGRPMRHNLTILIDHEDLKKFNFKVEFTLSFGGKYSPAKMSNYTLNLLAAKATEGDENANNLIAEMDENILFSDYQDRIGKSKDTFIKDHIRA